MAAMSEPLKRPRPAGKPKPAPTQVTSGVASTGTPTASPTTSVDTPTEAPRSGVEATTAPEATPEPEHEPTATEIAAERGAPPPRVAGDVRAAQEAHIKAEPDPERLDLSDGEILGMNLKNEVRRDEDGGVTHLLFELRDGRLLDVSAGSGVLDFTVRS